MSHETASSNNRKRLVKQHEPFKLFLICRSIYRWKFPHPTNRIRLSNLFLLARRIVRRTGDIACSVPPKLAVKDYTNTKLTKKDHNNTSCCSSAYLKPAICSAICAEQKTKRNNVKRFS